MKTSISSRLLPSRSSRMVDAGRGLTISAIRFRSLEPHPEERPLGASRRMSGNSWASWFETREAALLTMRKFLACCAGLRLQIGAAVDSCHPRQEVIDFGFCRRRNAGTGLALRAGGDHAALLQDVFAHREPRAGLLLVADQRQMRVEQIMRGIALAGLRKLHDVDKQFGKGVSGHRAVGTALHLEIEEQSAVADQNRQRAQRTVLLEIAKRGNLFQPRPVLVLEHDAGRRVHHDLADHRGREHDRQGQRVVLQHPGNIVADRFLCLLEIANNLVVSAQMRRRSDHDAGGARVHRRFRDRARGCKTGRRDADDDLHVLRALDEADRDLLGLVGVELRPPPENPKPGDPAAAGLGIEVGQPVDRFLVDAAVVMEWRRSNRETACGLGGKLHGVHLLVVVPGWSEGQTQNHNHQNRRAPILICSSEKKMFLAWSTISCAFHLACGGFQPSISIIRISRTPRGPETPSTLPVWSPDNSLTMYSTAGAMPSGSSAAPGFSL